MRRKVERAKDITQIIRRVTISGSYKRRGGDEIRTLRVMRENLVSHM